MRTLPFFAAVLGALTGAARLDAADLSTLAGKKYKGDLVAVDAQTLTFRTEVGTVGVPVKELFLLDFGRTVDVPAKGAKYDEVELTDGSVFRCTAFKIKKRVLEMTLLTASDAGSPPTVDLPLDAVFAVLRNADDPKNRTEWKRAILNRGKRDQLVVKRGEAFEPLSGTVVEGNDAGDTLTFEREDGKRDPIKLSRATGGLIFAPPPRGVLPPTVCKVVDAFGNTATAAAVELAGPGLKVKTVAGASVAYPDRKGVAKLDFSQGNVAYLSDLDPQVSAPDPVPGEPVFTYLRDKTNENTLIRLDGQTYGKGLWVFPDTALTYKLNAEYREFKAMIGVDESVQVASSSVKLTVEADGKVLFAGTVSRKEKAKPLTLDVKGVKVLKISVDRDALFLGNQLDLADARLQK